MGTVARRLFVVVALAALAVPSAARAGQTVYGPSAFQNGPQGGDTFNVINTDVASGRMTVLRVNPVPVSASLGCTGSGGFAYFVVHHTAVTAVTSVDVDYTNTVVDPYSWINVGIRQGTNFLATAVARGPITSVPPGYARVSVSPPGTVTGPIDIWFGLQVSSACPNVDGATATFVSLTITEA